MDFGFIFVSHLITLSIINTGFYNSFCCFNTFPAYKYQDTDMSNFRFTLLMRRGVSLYYFRTNASLYRIVSQSILYQISLINVDQYLCKSSVSGQQSNIIPPQHRFAAQKNLLVWHRYFSSQVNVIDTKISYYFCIWEVL